MCDPVHSPSPDPVRANPLVRVHLRCGLHTRTVTAIRDPIRRLQTFRLLHACSGCFRLERIAGWASHPLESAALSRRTPIEVVVLNCCVTDTKEAPLASRISTILAKSASERVSRSIL